MMPPPCALFYRTTHRRVSASPVSECDVGSGDSLTLNIVLSSTGRQFDAQWGAMHLTPV